MEMRKGTLKVLHIAFKHGKEDVRIFQKECTSLAARGTYEVVYITSDINSKDGDDVNNHVERRVIKARPKRIIRQIVYYRDIKKLIEKDDDITLVHLHEAPLLLLALWIKRRGIKVIYDSHEDYYQQIKVSRGSILAIAYKICERFVCKRIDGVIFPCKMLNKQVFDYPVRRLAYVDNYPLLREFPQRDEQQEFLACYTGTISWDRGVGNAVLGWERAEINGIIAGRFSKEEERRRIESLPGYSRVEYLGVLPQDQLQTEVYARASVGMATLRNVGQYHLSCNLPTKVGEYMMAKMPVIIYRTPYVEEIMEKYRFGIMVDPDNIDEIAAAIDYLRRHPKEARAMGLAGYQAVKDFFNWETQEKRLFELYDDVLGSN